MNIGRWLGGLLLANVLGCAACLQAQACIGHDQSLRQAKAHYAQRQDLAQAERASDIFRLVLDADPACQTAALGLARVSVWIGVLSSGEKELAAYARAQRVAEQAAQRHPENAEGHYWLGVALALQANANGALGGWLLVERAKSSLEKALELDAAYEGGGAHRVLGRLYCKLPPLLGGNRELAERHLRQALEFGPFYLLNHLYLADLLRQQDRRDEACELLHQVITGPAPSGLAPEHDLWRQQARQLLESLRRP